MDTETTNAAVETPVEQTEVTTNAEENAVNSAETTGEEVELNEDGQPKGLDFIPGPDDIVIEEDFDIQMDIQPISANPNMSGTGTQGIQQPQEQTPVNLGTEQSGNITF